MWPDIFRIIVSFKVTLSKGSLRLLLSLLGFILDTLAQYFKKLIVRT